MTVMVEPTVMIPRARKRTPAASAAPATSAVVLRPPTLWIGRTARVIAIDSSLSSARPPRPRADTEPSPQESCSPRCNPPHPFCNVVDGLRSTTS